jgi:hypothetical protein
VRQTLILGVRDVRIWRLSFVIAALAALVYATLQAQAVDATSVLGAAREALGGEIKLSAVRTFTATGRTRQLRGNNLVPIEFEINCELPDKFIRTDEFPAQDADPTTQGFNGDTLLQFPSPAPGRGGTPAPAQRLNTVKQDFVRLTLGMFAASFGGFPLTFKYAAVGEAPEGKADILDVAGPANFSARFVVQRETHLPVMLMWQQAPPNPQAKPSEYRLYYGDFRDVDGLRFPFRIRRAVAGDTVEETTFDRFKINTKIDPKKFESKK